MSRKTNVSAAELARRIENYLPVFARPMIPDLIAAVQRETRLGEVASIRAEYPPDCIRITPPNVNCSTTPAQIAAAAAGYADEAAHHHAATHRPTADD